MGICQHSPAACCSTTTLSRFESLWLQRSHPAMLELAAISNQLHAQRCCQIPKEAHALRPVSGRACPNMSRRPDPTCLCKLSLRSMIDLSPTQFRYPLFLL